MSQQTNNNNDNTTNAATTTTTSSLSSTIMLDEGEAILDSGSLYDVGLMLMNPTPPLQQQQPSTTNIISSSPSTSSATNNINNTSSFQQQQPQPQQQTTLDNQSNESTRRKRATSSASTSSTGRRNSSAKTKKKKNEIPQEDTEDNRSSSNDDGSSDHQESLSHHRLLPNQRVACPMEEVPPNQQGRYWIFETPDQGEPFNDVVVRVTMKIRGEEAKNYVPEKLYSSHKYVIMHEISGKSLVEKYPLIVPKIHVINPSTREELKNSKNSSKLCLMGTMETALTKSAGSSGKKSKETTSSEDVVKGQMKVQFTDVSYHHEKGHFGFVIHYFNPANLETPLFSLLAPPFNVFARKPTNENQTETLQPTKPKPSKRKRKSDQGNEIEVDGISSTAEQSSSTAVAAVSIPSSSSAVVSTILSSSTNPVQGTSSTTIAPATEETVSPPSKKKTRRQTKKQTEKNRANADESRQEAIIPTVTMNTVQTSQNLQLFNNKLEAILAIKKQLGQDASKKASELALQNLLTLDPFSAQGFILNQQQPSHLQQPHDEGTANNNGAASSSSTNNVL